MFTPFSSTIKDALEDSLKLQKSLDEEREVYRWEGGGGY